MPTLLFLELVCCKNHFNLPKIFVLNLFKMAANQTNNFRLEYRSVINCLWLRSDKQVKFIEQCGITGYLAWTVHLDNCCTSVIHYGIQMFPQNIFIYQPLSSDGGVATLGCWWWKYEIMCDGSDLKKIWFFSNEKNFNQDQMVNLLNNRGLALSPQEVPILIKTKYQVHTIEVKKC